MIEIWHKKRGQNDPLLENIKHKTKQNNTKLFKKQLKH